MFSSVLGFLGSFRRDQDGAVLLELALITPLMILLSAGVFEFGNLIHSKLLMEAGLDDAARFAARCNPKVYTDNSLPAIDCRDIARNIAVFGNVAGTGNSRVAGLTKADVDVVIGDPLVDGPPVCQDVVIGGVTQYLSVTPKVCIVRATGTLTYAGVGLLAAIDIGPITLNGSHEERLIRF